MAFSAPYETDQYIAYLDLVITTTLSFAVMLIDDLTKKESIGSIQVKVKETDKKAMKNPSGYYLFTDLKAGTYTVRVDSDLYFSEEKTVNIASIPDKKNPIIKIILIPRPAYPFPKNATLVRGKVVSNSKNQVDGISVVVKGSDTKNITDSRGEFVLYFKDIIKEQNITLEINRVDEHSITAKEGKTASLGIIFIA